MIVTAPKIPCSPTSGPTIASWTASGCVVHAAVTFAWNAPFS